MGDLPYRVTVNMGGVRVGDKVMIDPGSPNLEGLLTGPHPKLVPWDEPETIPVRRQEAPGGPAGQGEGGTLGTATAALLDAPVALPLPDDPEPEPDVAERPSEETPAVAP